MNHIINVKELRATMAEIVRHVQRGENYTVLYRSRPAFRIVGLDAGTSIEKGFDGRQTLFNGWF